MSMKRRSDPKYIQAYERGMLRSAFVSLFWGVISERKKRGGFTLKGLAKSLGTNKAEVSRWFNGNPNWTVNTIANIATALDLELRIEARERSSGIIFTASGIQLPQVSQLQSMTDPVRTDAELLIKWKATHSVVPKGINLEDASVSWAA
jgi:transcriptional regulator with XRE-family HTH domain